MKTVKILKPLRVRIVICNELIFHEDQGVFVLQVFMNLFINPRQKPTHFRNFQSESSNH